MTKRDETNGGAETSTTHERFVQRLRRATVALDAELAPEREDALIERVLSATTRREAPLLSFEGMRHALARSGLARLVAASLVLHVGALGVVAMLAVREAKAPIGIKIQPTGTEEPLFAPIALEPELESPLDLEARVARERANRLRLDRFLLVRAAEALWPEHDAGAPFERPSAASEERLDAILSRDWASARSRRVPTGFDERGLVATAMELDAWLFDRATDSTARRLGELDRYPVELADTVARLRDRARAYGLLEGRPTASLHPLGDVHPELPPIDVK